MSDGSSTLRSAERPGAGFPRTTEGQLYPKAPVLGWDAWAPNRTRRPPGIGDLPQQRMTTSGRAALLAALRELAPAPGMRILVPAYHCPTMVAPVVTAGLSPVFFPLDDLGLPRLEHIDRADTDGVKAMIVAHYFGLPRDLRAVAEWCRERRIALIEDCAHSLFGVAGDRPVGHWGDFATASLSKFLPIPEAGLLASARRRLQASQAPAQAWRSQIKALVDVMEHAHRHQRLAIASHLAAPMLWLKNRGGSPVPDAAPSPPSPSPQSMLESCDMGRAELAPTMVARALYRTLPLGGLVERRRRHYSQLAEALGQLDCARPLQPIIPDQAVPYVMPLLVEDVALADRVYALSREHGLPVFRWDRLWPGSRDPATGAEPHWSRRVLQLLCHQSLTDDDVGRVAQLVHDALCRR